MLTTTNKELHGVFFFSISSLGRCFTEGIYVSSIQWACLDPRGDSWRLKHLRMCKNRQWNNLQKVEHRHLISLIKGLRRLDRQVLEHKSWKRFCTKQRDLDIGCLHEALTMISACFNQYSMSRLKLASDNKSWPTYV